MICSFHSVLLLEIAWVKYIQASTGFWICCITLSLATTFLCHPGNFHWKYCFTRKVTRNLGLFVQAPPTKQPSTPHIHAAMGGIGSTVLFEDDSKIGPEPVSYGLAEEEGGLGGERFLQQLGEDTAAYVRTVCNTIVLTVPKAIVHCQVKLLTHSSMPGEIQNIVRLFNWCLLSVQSLVLLRKCRCLQSQKICVSCTIIYAKKCTLIIDSLSFASFILLEARCVCS